MTFNNFSNFIKRARHENKIKRIRNDEGKLELLKKCHALSQFITRSRNEMERKREID